MDSLKIPPWIRESNLIEGVDDPADDLLCFKAYKWFMREPMSLETILELHKKVMSKRLNPEYVGIWRPVDVTVGGRLCPPWQEVPYLIKDWLLRWGPAASDAQATIAHVAFEHVHPFVDGNGRIGRMIMNWQRHFAYLPPAKITYFDRWEYYGWFR